MEIIAEKMGGYDYYFSVDGREKYSAYMKAGLFVKNRRQLLNVRGDEIIAEIFSKQFLFNLKYNVTDNQGKHRFLIQSNMKKWRPFYSCSFEDDDYLVVPHKGLKNTIYKNDKQVAYFQNDRVQFANSDKIKMLADNDLDPTFLSLILLALACDFGSNSSAVTFDFGNIMGPEYKPFDKKWRPNQNK